MVRRFLSFLLPVILLSLFAESALHAFEHKDDFHCTATEQHIHTPEHTCSLCDQQLPFVENVKPFIQKTTFQFVAFFAPQHNTFFPSSGINNPTSRGPPACLFFF